MDLLIGVHIKSPLDEGECHLEGLHAELWAVLGDELQPFDPHEATVAGRILLQVLQDATQRVDKHSSTGRRESTQKKITLT